jgi:hypothetical protein
LRILHVGRVVEFSNNAILRYYLPRHYDNGGMAVIIHRTDAARPAHFRIYKQNLSFPRSQH